MKPRILLVHDDPNLLDDIRRALHARQDAWSVSCATSASQALEKLRDEAIDTIVTDVAMPGMDGFDLLQRLQAGEDTKRIPVVVLTASRERGLKSRVLDLGATDLLAKPVDYDELVARLRNTLRLKAYQDDMSACNAALRQKVAEKSAELASSQFDMIWRLARTAEFYNEDTANHVIRIGFYCRNIAEAMGMDAEFVERIALASPLHDIGKVAIPASILQKPGSLTANERAIMQQHCAIGAEMLRQNMAASRQLSMWDKSFRDWIAARSHSPLLQTAASIALTHHERWDGCGYLQRLQGERIPLESRIVAVADAYDALRSFRPHRPAQSHQQAIERMGHDQGRHFDPEVYAAFLRVGDAMQSITLDLCEADYSPAREVRRP